MSNDRVLYPVYEKGHWGNRVDDVEYLGSEGDRLRIRALRPGNARLVLRSAAPLSLVAAAGCEARLRQGWDGTLGYSLYGLELSFSAPRILDIVIHSIRPPAEPESTSAEDIARFREEYCGRSSRFPDDGDGFRSWQGRYRSRLTSLLMGGCLPERVPLEPREVGRREFAAFDLYRIDYRTRADRRSELLLSLPRESVSPAPLLVALHGHEANWGKADEAAFEDPDHSDGFCRYFADRGWAVMQPATMDHLLQNQRWCLPGEWSWDAMVAVDYAVNQPNIDSGRIAVCGLSTGACLAMCLLALDDRVQAGVVGCIFSTWHHYRRFRIPPHCDCGLLDKIASEIEQCDLAALAAPKPVQFQHGRQDVAFCPGADHTKLKLDWNTGVMPPEEYATAFDEVRRAYRIAGAPGRVESRIHEGPHRVDNEMALGWLSR